MLKMKGKVFGMHQLYAWNCSTIFSDVHVLCDMWCMNETWNDLPTKNSVKREKKTALASHERWN